MSRVTATLKYGLGALLVVTLLAVAAPSARAESFDSFCAEWMGKLAQREQQNAAKVQYSPGSGGVEGKYTGYERVPVRCQTRAKPGAPGVGDGLAPRRIGRRREGFACVGHGRLSLYRGFGQSVDLVEHGLPAGARRRHHGLERQARRRRECSRADGDGGDVPQVGGEAGILDHAGEHRCRAR